MLTGAQPKRTGPSLLDKIVLLCGAAFGGWISIELLNGFFGIGSEDSLAYSLFAFFR